jgi:transcriptional regulator with XRE-family HTH domain
MRTMTDSIATAGAHGSTIDTATDDEAMGERLGAHIRALRHSRGLTLVRLADATGLSHPFLSQLERGLAQPSLSSLRRIALALETSPIELIAAADPPEGGDRVEVHRRGEALVAGTFASTPARMLAHGPRPLHPLEVEGDHTDPGDTFQHREDEFLYVLEGAVQLELDGEVRAVVPGDSAYYRGGVAHRWWSADGGRFRLLVVKQGLGGEGRWSAP